MIHLDISFRFKKNGSRNHSLVTFFYLFFQVGGLSVFLLCLMLLLYFIECPCLYNMSTLDKAYLFIIHYTCFEISRVCAPIALCDWTKSGYVLLYFIVCMGFGCLCSLLLCQNYMISVHCKIWAIKYHSKMFIDKRLVLLSCGHSTIIKRLISFYSNFIKKFCLFWFFFILFFFIKICDMVR